MHPTRVMSITLVVLALAGCSKPAAQLTGPSSESSRLAPGLPPIEQSSPPRIRVWTDDGWREAQKEGAFSLAPENIFDLEIREGESVTFHWSAQPAGLVVGSRWTLDIEDLVDETPRVGPEDIQHWSQWSSDVTSATVGPLSVGLHWFYIEARTKVGFFSLFPIRLNVVSASESAVQQAR
jgi:hypothetical protein